MIKIQSQSTSAANTIAQNAAIKALELDNNHFKDIKTSLLKRRAIVISAYPIWRVSTLILAKAHFIYSPQ